jgi:hypothetical protein
MVLDTSGTPPETPWEQCPTSDIALTQHVSRAKNIFLPTVRDANAMTVDIFLASIAIEHGTSGQTCAEADPSRHRAEEALSRATVRDIASMCSGHCGGRFKRTVAACTWFVNHDTTSS